MVSVMWANNETGVLLPIHDIAMCCRDRGILFHTDAVQAIGKIPVHVDEVPVDLLSLSAHKMNAPKGVGALYIRKGTPFAPFLHGGGQEAGRRAGTQNMAGIVGLGKAAELASARLSQKDRVGALRDHLEQGMLQSIPNLKVNGHPTLRLPNTSNVCFDGIEAEALLHQLDRLEVAASSGSACSSGSLEPSHVLTAMGLSPRQALSSIRFSLGIETCQEEVDYLLQHLPEQVRRLRGYSPLSQ
jgi:cysteine desulfurase